MDGDPSSLAILEQYVKELFSGSASNEQLQKIHASLDHFARQKESWRECLYFLSRTSNHETAMYALTVLEGFITKRWTGLTNTEQLELRSALNQWLTEKHQHVPFFIRNKAIQLVVHIARTDWPEKYPEFYDTILMLVSSADVPSTTLGLLFLQTASEELATPRDDLLSSRKAELKQLLLQLVPNTLLILTGLLEAIWEKQSHSITSTPPPSPTNPLPQSSPHCLSARRGVSQQQLDCELEPIVLLSLQCLTHLFSWIPLSSHVTPNLMQLVFRFVGLGTQQSLPQLSNGTGLSVPVVALGTINEMLYKNCVPAEFEEFVVLLFNNCCIILHHLVDNTNNSHLPHPIQPQFVDKFLELIHLLVSSHLKRLQGRQLPLFSVPQFLSLFFGYTFQQNEWTRYMSCLDTWQVFLEYIKQSSANDAAGSPSSSYHDSLTTLCDRVLHKILFANNANQLDLLDDDAQDGNLETEWQKVLRQSIEIFVTAGEIVNNQTLSILNDPFERGASAYQTLAAMAASSDGTIAVGCKRQAKELLIVFKDLASLLQLIGRLSELHTGADYDKHFETGKSLVLRLLNLASYGTTVIGAKWADSVPKELKHAVSQVHAHCLSALQAWCHWLSRWVAATSSYRNGGGIDSQAVVDATVSCATSVFSTASLRRGCDENNQVLLGSLQLLSSVVNVVRSGALWSSATWNDLFQSAHEIQPLASEVRRRLLSCIYSSAFVAVPRKAQDEHGWMQRQQKLSSAVHEVARPARLLVQSLNDSTGHSAATVAVALQQARSSVLETLTLLQDLATLVKEESTSSKVLLAVAMEPWTGSALVLLSYYIHDHQVTEAVFQFYCALFDSMLSQIGIACAEKAVHTFLQTFTQCDIQVTLQQESSHGAIEQFLRILQIVVQEPGAAFKRFLPSTLTLCLDHVYPSIAQMPSCDLKETFYKLITLILCHHWRYFFKGSVLTTYGSRDSDRSEPVENQPQFLSIMAAYGQSFLLSDISIFQQNLEALQNLHTKWKLYHKAIFRDTVSSQFISTLLAVLTNGSHELLREEIALAIYAMASPDFDAFFQTIFTHFLLSSRGIDDRQRHALKNDFSSDTDLPSFTRNIHRLTNDLRCYRLANASLQP